MKLGELGAYIRNQRKGARLSLSAVSAVAGVSIPYLSQIERGLRKPSAEILQAIARGLRISAETLYVQAGILEDRPVTDVVSAVMADAALAQRHKQALVEIYRAFREEAGRMPETSEATVSPGEQPEPTAGRRRARPRITNARKEV
jgi:transcriptional regulator with XRE-family HTH domain